MKYPHLAAFLRLLSLALLLSASWAAAYTTPRMFGVNLAGGEFAGAYFYPKPDHIDYAKGIGAELARVPFKWQRVHHETTPGTLDATLWEPDMVQLDASIDAMEARGMRIILDMHNYGGREITVNGVLTVKRIGSPELPVSEYARAWKLIADRYKNRPSIWGYDLMNEPTSNLSMAELITMYQAAVNAIRTVDIKHAIILEGRGNNHSSSWLTSGVPLFDPSTGVVDPVNNLIASAHCYMDEDQSGTGSGSVNAELVATGVYPDLASAYNVGVDRVKPFVDWCAANNVRGLLGEYTLPGKNDTANWDIASERLMAYMRDNSNGLVSGTQWAAGGITYNQQRMMPRIDNSKPPSQETFLPQYFSGIGTNYATRWIWYGGDDDTLISTGGTNYAYVFPAGGNITATLSNTSPTYFGPRSIAIHWQLPVGTSGGGGLHTGGPTTAGAVGGIDISSAILGGQSLVFQARGTPGANISVTIASTSDSNDVDTQNTTGATITQTGNYVSLSSIAPLNDTFQRYEIPLSSIVNSSLNGSRHVQRLLFLVTPSDGAAYDVYLDSIIIDNSTTNTAPTATVNTSTGGSSFTTDQTINLVATASDPNGIDYVEFFANHAKVGIDDISPYQAAITLAAGTYDLTSVAYDMYGVPTQSAVKSITVTNPATVPPASAPTNVTATSGDGQATISWFGVSDATYYNVKRSISSGGPFVTVASPSGINYTDTGLTNNTTYYYVVSAANAAGQSANSSVVSVVPLPPPPAPTVLKATVGSGRVALSWTSVATALSYNVKRATTSGGPYTLIGSSTTTDFNDATVTNGTTYYYVVSGVNNAGEGSNSLQLVVTPQAATTIIKDNSDSTGITKTGTWTSSTSAPTTDYYGTNYLHDGNTGSTGTKKVVFTPTIASAGNYDVYGRWPAASGRATNVPFDINYSGGGLETRTVNQADTSNNGKWVFLGTYSFATGTAGNVTIRNAGANGFVIADAVQFVGAPSTAVITLGNLSATYDGSPKAATATTSPTGLSVSLTYNGSSTAPTAAGSYTVVASVTTAGYVGNVATGTLVITQPPIEIIVDNLAAEYTATWTSSTFMPHYYSSNYRTRASGGVGNAKMRWRPTITTAGTYQVYYWLPDGSADRPSNAPFTVYYNGGSQTYLVDERVTPGGQWILLGSFPFAAGTTGYVEMTDNANGTNLIGDAIRFYKP